MAQGPLLPLTIQPSRGLGGGESCSPHSTPSPRPLSPFDSPAWGCSNLVCYTDYIETITCILETWAGHPDSLTLTW